MIEKYTYCRKMYMYLIMYLILWKINYFTRTFHKLNYIICVHVVSICAAEYSASTFLLFILCIRMYPFVETALASGLWSNIVSGYTGYIVSGYTPFTLYPNMETLYLYMGNIVAPQCCRHNVSQCERTLRAFQKVRSHCILWLPTLYLHTMLGIQCIQQSTLFTL